jgi:Bacterial transglutaminase-like cysteine proteinase BTLCP
MVAEVISRAYDGDGKLVSQPSKKRHRFFKPTFPMGTYVSQPLATKCNRLEEIRLFLAKCRYVSDQEQFNQADYWMPPEQFEERKKGDCDDFALWTWRQLMSLGYDARFVSGLAGRYGNVHAWVTFTENGRMFLVEPTAARLGPKLPRLSTFRYQPRLSVAWDGKRLQYYEHEKRSFDPSLWEMITLVSEWLPFWIRTRSRGYYAWARYFIRRAINMFRMPDKGASDRSLNSND